MKTIEILFWTLIAIVFYTYIGCGIILYIMITIKRLIKKNKNIPQTNYEPDVTLLIAAYNEKDFVDQKVHNTRKLDYPAEKLHQIWVTDGSDDGTPDLLRKHPEITVLHLPGRNGKIAAMNRGMKKVETPIVIFSDANTLLGENSIRKIVELFKNTKTGCVSGEKRIQNFEKNAAAGAGEGIYWKYESTLKKWDAELNSVVGAAGELFAIRTELFHEVEPDTILDDFIISLRVAMQGYKIQYDPEAFAMEMASANVEEELKRKIRIAAGGIQSIIRLLPLLNIFKYKLLSFQYISHRVLRWTVAPLAIVIIFVLNIFLLNSAIVYSVIFYGQFLFYAAAILGWYLEKKEIKLKVIFIPYYFFIMNYAVYMGFLRFIKKSQSVNWERAKRG
ncbi:MAG: glycosyltransferase family 2 protein [Salinivirgaceae bacterium]|nr:glycosyltransferase family 2 protein [Salinivirgaceae bacterium]